MPESLISTSLASNTAKSSTSKDKGSTATKSDHGCRTRDERPQTSTSVTSSRCTFEKQNKPEGRQKPFGRGLPNHKLVPSGVFKQNLDSLAELKGAESRHITEWFDEIYYPPGVPQPPLKTFFHPSLAQGKDQQSGVEQQSAIDELFLS